VDPLDGTKAYARLIPGFSVMVALLFQGRPVLGVVYDPLDGHLFEAVRGGGCYHTHQGRRRRVRVSDRARFDEMPVVVSTGFPETWRSFLADELKFPFLPPINSVGIKVAHVVRQEADVYINHHPVHLWDTAAPGLILAEAGGRMTLLDGTPLAYDLDGDLRHPQGTLATNGRRHQDLVSIVRRAPAR
jgi:3'(2'), 5'-bisphosphate nucleotidase